MASDIFICLEAGVLNQHRFVIEQTHCQAVKQALTTYSNRDSAAHELTAPKAESGVMGLSASKLG